MRLRCPAPAAASNTAYASHLLDPCGVPPRMLRCTRLADLVNATDPKLVAAFGMNPEGVMIYLADHVDDGRLPEAVPSQPPPAATPRSLAGPTSPGTNHRTH